MQYCEGLLTALLQALNRREATAFYRSLASLTDGFHLQLDQFSSIVSFMLAICFREEGGDTLDTYEEEVRGQGRGMNREIHRLFNTLQVGIVNTSHCNNLYQLTSQGRTPAGGGGGDGWVPAVREDGLVPVNPSRFQVTITDFCCIFHDFNHIAHIYVLISMHSILVVGSSCAQQVQHQGVCDEEQPPVQCWPRVLRVHQA